MFMLEAIAAFILVTAVLSTCLQSVATTHNRHHTQRAIRRAFAPQTPSLR
ncbi:MAG: hypothetical protein K0V04_07850 [Deltaproteobacteria bacterium]|nr:hypothetical protein [Deltaproteobacteria bacterium]